MEKEIERLKSRVLWDIIPTFCKQFATCQLLEQMPSLFEDLTKQLNDLVSSVQQAEYQSQPDYKGTQEVDKQLQLKYLEERIHTEHMIQQFVQTKILQAEV